MTTYREIAASEVDADSPITATLMSALANNFVSFLEGDSTAPALTFAALGRLEAGTEIRSRNEGVTTPEGSANYGDLISIGIMQVGTIRCEIDYVSGQVAERRVLRVRDGVSTTVASETGATALSADISVIHGDTITLQASGDATTADGVVDARIMTNGQNLWAGAGAKLEGNDVS
jgi:hypothetical protein